MKLGLGTVQFGMDYGISNKDGRPTKSEVKKILEYAERSGIRFIDTSAQYGDAEKILGEILSPHPQFDIVTKGQTHDLIDSFNWSLDNMRQSKIYGFLIHDSHNLTRAGGTNLFNKMKDLKDRGLVKKIGASVYDMEQIERVIELSPIDMIQLPLNILAQSLYKTGYIKKLKEKGIEIHVRSALLQGLLLIPPNQLPVPFEDVKNHLLQLHQVIKKEGLSVLEVCLGFTCNIPEVSSVIVGVNSLNELKELIRSVEGIEKKKDVIDRIAELAAWKDEKLLDPRLWGKNG